MMKRFAFFRKMNVILFLAFVLFSTVFIFLIISIDSMNWNQVFTSFQSKSLEKTAYLILDDMKREKIGIGPLSEEQTDWLRRRAALFGVLLRYESTDHKHVWLDTYARAGRTVDDSVSREALYVTGGSTLGYIRISDMSQKSDLDPAFQQFQETIKLRTRVLLAAIVLVAIVFSLLVARRLSKPLHRVYTMASEISAGRRDIRIPVKGPEEVRRLAATLNEMTKELKRQEDWRDHLMEDIMHELRTPLTSILSQMEAIVDGLYEPDSDRMEDIYEDLVRLSRLVNDLERLSEAEAARFTMNVRTTDMVVLTRRVYNSHKALAREKGIKLAFEPTNVPCKADVDRDKMVQVLTNLVLNAIKYTPSGGTVTLSVDWTKDHTILSCRDTGIGIGANDLPYIFNRLYRADKSRSRFSGGAGLGLSITKALVEAHNGVIEAESQLGRGSCFTVTVPNVYRAYGEEFSGV